MSGREEVAAWIPSIGVAAEVPKVPKVRKVPKVPNDVGPFIVTILMSKLKRNPIKSAKELNSNVFVH